MREHTFRVGQVVNLIATERDGTLSSAREYKILRLLRNKARDAHDQPNAHACIRSAMGEGRAPSWQKG
jgi:hypothetical protein